MLVVSPRCSSTQRHDSQRNQLTATGLTERDSCETHASKRDVMLVLRSKSNVFAPCCKITMQELCGVRYFIWWLMACAFVVNSSNW